MNSVLGILAPLLILGAIVAAAVYGVSALRRRADPEPDPGIGTLRRLYFYVISFVALMMATVGLGQIGQFLLESLIENAILSASATRLAVGISIAVVGLPLWAFHWRVIQRYAAELPVERRSVVRKVYMYLVLGVAVGGVGLAAMEILQWAFGGKTAQAYPFAAIVVWGAVWALHWRIETGDGCPSAETLAVRRLYLYAVSLVGLIMAAGGLGTALHSVLLQGYESATGATLLSSETPIWNTAVREGLGAGLVGATAWASHWLWFARRDMDSLLREVYLYLFGSLGGAATVLVALGIAAFQVMTWALGATGDATAAIHFRFVPGVVVSAALGLAIWGYHRAVAGREAPPDESEVARTYSYLLTAAGVGTVAVGVATLVHLLVGIGADLGRTLIGPGTPWRDQAAAVVALGLVGVPLWSFNWLPIQRRAAAPDGVERLRLVRRIFLIAALAAGVLTVLVSLSSLVFVILRDLLQADVSRDTLGSAGAPLSGLAAAAVFLPYYWTVHQMDRRLAPERAVADRAVRRKAVTVLVGAGGDAFVQALEGALGYRVLVGRWADPDATTPRADAVDLAGLARQVRESPGDRVLLVPEPGRVRVLSYN